VCACSNSSLSFSTTPPLPFTPRSTLCYGCAPYWRSKPRGRWRGSAAGKRGCWRHSHRCARLADSSGRQRNSPELLPLRNVIGVRDAQFILPDGSTLGVDAARERGRFEPAISDLAWRLISARPEFDSFGIVDQVSSALLVAGLGARDLDIIRVLVSVRQRRFRRLRR
jgi:hypothetical protein